MKWFRQLDDLLRGRKTRPEQLLSDRLDLALHVFLPLAILLGAAYGFFMGWFSVLNRVPPNYMQIIASMVKLPALFLLTLLVTLPSLYVFNALVGCRLSFTATLRLLVGAVVVNLAVAASFGTILGFFTFSTTSYPFMILLNVLLLSIAGVVGLAFLLQTLRRLVRRPMPPTSSSEPYAPTSEGEPPPLPRPSEISAAEPYEVGLGQANQIFRIWVIIYALVGAQMGWLLRPFIGSPNLPFAWFRHREGDVFSAIYHNLLTLLGK